MRVEQIDLRIRLNDNRGITPEQRRKFIMNLDSAIAQHFPGCSRNLTIGKAADYEVSCYDRAFTKSDYEKQIKKAISKINKGIID